jgi:ketosteroid isomerase-like protein
MSDAPAVGPHATEPLTGDAAAVWAGMNAVYQGFLGGAPDLADAHLHPDVTIWDSAHAPMVFGLRGLAALRAARAATTGSGEASTAVAGIEATEPVVDVWGDVALLRHVLRVRFAGDTPDETVRNTSVWRRVDGRWLAVHNHEDVLPGPEPGG